MPVRGCPLAEFSADFLLLSVVSCFQRIFPPQHRRKESMSAPRKQVSPFFSWLLIAFSFFFAGKASAQTCYTSEDMDASAKAAIESAANNYFGMITRGDAASLKQNAIASLAADFTGIEGVVNDNKADLAAGTVTPESPYLLKLDGAAPAPRAEFLCGVFGANGQTSNSAVFVLRNLSPGTYGFEALDVRTAKSPYTVSFVLQQEGAAWKLAGLFVKNTEINGHDGNWFLDKARAFKAKNELYDAWYYFIEAHSLLTPVDFMSTQATDKLYDEAQSAKPSELPPMDLSAANGKTYKLIAMFPLVVGADLDLIIRFQSNNVSNTSQAFQDNMAVIKAIVTKYPQLREAFGGIVARATEPSGQDYGTMREMKDIK
jgi:hypothetical protein